MWHWDNNYTQVQSPNGPLTLRKDEITKHTGHTNFAPTCQEFNMIKTMLGISDE